LNTPGNELRIRGYLERRMEILKPVIPILALLVPAIG